MSAEIGTRRVCVNCDRVIVAVRNPRVISLTAGTWVHATKLGRLMCRYATPGAALTEETTCSTCGGAGEVRCLAHIAGDGCVDMVFACPDCLTEEGGQ